MYDFRFSAISRPKAVKMTFEERMKLKTDLKQTQGQEKEMWNAVNQKRDVKFREFQKKT